MPSLYERDFFAWANEQAALLRAGRLNEADLVNIIEEIDSMGRSERRELVNRLARIEAERETGLPEATFPVDCPFSLDKMMDEAFWPADAG